MSDWIDWKGGECPVENGVMVEYMIRSDTNSCLEVAGCLSWVHCDTPADITAYRIVSQDVPKDFGQQNQVKYERGVKQSRYMSGNGNDHIDSMFEQLNFDQFTGAIWFTIGKYFARMNRKDDIEKEAEKIADYACRYLEKVRDHKARLCESTTLSGSDLEDGSS